MELERLGAEGQAEQDENLRAKAALHRCMEGSSSDGPGELAVLNGGSKLGRGAIALLAGARERGTQWMLCMSSAEPVLSS